MFFDMDLLCLKRHGKFALIWLAANRGVRSIAKSQIEHVNIIKTCEDIFKYYTTKSVAPRQRLSLFLSAKLMYGAVLVYRQQVLNLEQTIITFICLIRRPISLIPDDVDLEGTRKKRGTKRKRGPLSTQEKPNLLLSRGEQQLVELRECEEQLRRSLPLQDINQTHGSNITLRDEIRAPQGHAETDLFGDEGQIDYQLAQFNLDGLLFSGAVNALEMPPPPPPASTPLPDLNRIQEPDPTTRQLSTPVSRKRPHSPQEVHSPHTRRKIVENIVDVVEQQPAEPQPVSVGASPPVEAQVPMVPPPIPPPTRRPHFIRRIRGNMNTSVRNLHLGENRFLNRIDVNFEAIGRNISGQIMSPRTRDVDPAKIMELLLSGVKFTAADVSAVVIGNVRENLTMESSSNELTVAHEVSIRSRTQGAKSSIIPANESVHELELVPVVQENIEEPVLEMIIDPVIPSPRLSRIQKFNEDIRSVTEQGQGDAGPRSPKRDRVHTSTPVLFQTDLNRQQHLINRLRSMFVELEGKDQCLTIDHIVFPLNRFNVAVTFADLLTLQTINYVTLVSKPINELHYITPGARLLTLIN